jgi:hypothetical protein
LTVIALTLTLLGCSGPALTPASAPPPTTTAAPTSLRLGLVRASVDGLVKAARAGDRPGFDRLVSDRDPTFRDRARLLYSNLSTLPLTRLQVRMEPTEYGLADARRRLLGPSAWVQRGVVTWRLPGDGTEVEHRIWLTFLEAGGEVKIAGTMMNHPAVQEQQPSWWLGPPRRASRMESRWRQAQVSHSIAGHNSPKPRSPTFERSSRTVSELVEWAAVIEVPATQRDFESVLGKPAGTYSSIAAVTHRAGTSGDALRIVVNPKTARLTSGEVQSVLEHEMVHVATRSPESPAPVWAEEGLAEWVSMRAHPDQRSQGTDELLAQVRSDGPPRSFPADGRFQAGARNIDLAYAQAWLACRFIADRYSESQLGRFYDELDRGDSVDEASQSTLHLSQAALTSRWRDYLAQLARY